MTTWTLTGQTLNTDIFFTTYFYKSWGLCAVHSSHTPQERIDQSSSLQKILLILLIIILNSFSINGRFHGVVQLTWLIKICIYITSVRPILTYALGIRIKRKLWITGMKTLGMIVGKSLKGTIPTSKCVRWKKTSTFRIRIRIRTEFR